MIESGNAKSRKNLSFVIIICQALVDYSMGLHN